MNRLEHNHFGYCDRCGASLYPVWFREYEYDNAGIATGRYRTACSHLVCENCGIIEPVDDTFDRPWHQQRIFARNSQ